MVASSPAGRCRTTPTATARPATAALHPALEHLVPAVAGHHDGADDAHRVEQAQRDARPGPVSSSTAGSCPGTTEADVERAVRDRLGDGIPYELDWPEQPVAGSASPAEGRCSTCARRSCDTADPGTVLLPSLSTGFTDSVYLRAACGTVAYGFSPMLATPPDVALAGFHAKDERVHVDDLLLAVQFHEQAARALLG